MGKKATEDFGRETKAADTTVVEINDRTITGIVSVFGVKDSYNDIIKKGAFTKTIKENFDRIKFLWQHNWSGPPVAAIKRLWEEGKGKLPKQVRQKFPEATGGLFVTREYLPTPRGDEILAGIKSEPPAINEMSIGYDPVDVKFDKDVDGANVRILKQVRLWDASDVNWGANEATVAEKCIAYKQTPLADIDKEWGSLSKRHYAEDSDCKMMGAMFDEDENCPMFLHHELEKNYPVNFNGVKYAMSELLTEKITNQERKAVYEHLAKHYKQFDKEPPDFKVIELAYQANQLIQEGVDSEVIAPLIKYAENIIAAEPVRPLTVSTEEFLALKTRFEIMNRYTN